MPIAIPKIVTGLKAIFTTFLTAKLRAMNPKMVIIPLFILFSNAYR
jgi:hypothetical protein